MLKCLFTCPKCTRWHLVFLAVVCFFNTTIWTNSTSAFIEDNPPPTLTWIVYEQAPYFVRNGKLKNQGIGDILLEHYFAALPNFKHQKFYANLNRYALATQRANICVPLAWSQKEEAHLLHSRPHGIEPPMGLLSASTTQIPKTAENTFSLAHIMANSNFRLLAFKTFPYGLETMRVLNTFENTDRILYQSSEQLEVNVRLITRGRADIALALPARMADLDARGRGQDFHFHQIEEIKNYVRLMTHCSNDQIGQQAMKIINQTLTDEFLELFSKHYFRWYHDNEAFEKLFHRYIINREDVPNVGDSFDQPQH